MDRSGACSEIFQARGTSAHIPGRFVKYFDLSQVIGINVNTHFFFPANVAAGNIEGVAQDWIHLPPNYQGKGLEIVLQAHTLAGFPRTINALIKIQEVGLHPEGDKHYEEVHNLEAWNKAGHETLRTVYGPVSEKMLKTFSKMHPLLELILVEHIYGRVLSRSLVDLRTRELCSLAIIAGQNLPVQLVSIRPHFRVPPIYLSVLPT